MVCEMRPHSSVLEMLITCSPSFSCIAQQFRLSQHAAHLHSKNAPFENLKLSHTAAACFALKKKLQRRNSAGFCRISEKLVPTDWSVGIFPKNGLELSDIILG
jgi:hypothetical protein